MVPRSLPSLNKECVLLHPLQGASFLSTPLQGGILKPPALRVVGDVCRACSNARRVQVPGAADKAASLMR